MSQELAAKQFIQSCSLVLEPSATVEVAIQAMSRQKTSYALVMDRTQMVGLFTENDAVRAIAAQQPLCQASIVDWMVQPVFTVLAHELTHISQVIQLFHQHCTSHLPVLNAQQQLVGVMTPSSIRESLQPTPMLEQQPVHRWMAPTTVCDESNATLQHIAHCMVERGVPYVILMAKDSSCLGGQPKAKSWVEPWGDRTIAAPFGILTASDLVQCYASGIRLAQASAREFCSAPLLSVLPRTDLWATHQLLQAKQLRQVGVFSAEEELLGIATYGSVLKALHSFESVPLLPAAMEPLSEPHFAKHVHPLSHMDAEQIQDAFDMAVIGMALVSLDGHLLAVNQALCTMVGYSKAELTAMTLQGLTYPEDPHEDISLVWLATAGEMQSYQVEKRYIHKNGSWVWVLLTVSLGRDRWANSLYFVCQIQDMTVEKVALRDCNLAQQQLTAVTQRLQYLLHHSPAILMSFQCDKDQAITFVSDTITTILGYKPKAFLQNASLWFSLVHPDDLPELLDSRLNQPNSTQQTNEYRILHADQKYRWVREVYQLANDQDHTAAEYVGYVIDISNRKMAEHQIEQYHTQLEALVDARTKELEQTNQRLQTEIVERRLVEQAMQFQNRLLNVVEHAVIATDLAGIILYWNRYSETMYGWTSFEVVGKHIFDILPSDLSHPQKVEILEHLRRGESWSGELRVQHRNGIEFPILATNSPIYDEQGKLIGIVSISIDISERCDLKDALKRTNAELGMQVETQARDLDDAVDQLYREISKRKHIEEMLRLQADRDRILSNITNRMRRSLDLNEVLTAAVTDVHELLKCDRALVYQFKPNCDGFVAVESVSDPTLAILGMRLIDPCFGANSEYLIRYQLGRSRAIANIQKSDLQACHRKTLAHLQVKANLVVGIVSNSQLWGLLICHQCQATREWQDWEVDLLKKIADQMAIAIQQSELYNQLQQANQKLEQLAITDDLTQIANRRRFDAHLLHEWQRLAHEQKALSLILCDVDYFKAFNDTYGHQAGDQCLVAIARLINQAATRTTDLAARYGGEEFALILPNTSSKGAEHVARSLQQAIAEQSMPHRASAIAPYVTASMGIATVTPLLSYPAQTLVNAADQALYEAKERGRNTICTHLLTLE
ncbi:diguanylate cyclase domain-containing protein [Leptolyngbya sp. AN02str]|uniref:diguanylate cyclase domain-containing protein n=1 Tax=Leptolyngbya sp. AN02str TaxID=3423363 RepID=UPI003D310A1D